MRGSKTVTPATGRCDCLAAWLALLAILFAGVEAERAADKSLTPRASRLPRCRRRDLPRPQ